MSLLLLKSTWGEFYHPKIVFSGNPVLEKNNNKQMKSKFHLFHSFSFNF